MQKSIANVKASLNSSPSRKVSKYPINLVIPVLLIRVPQVKKVVSYAESSDEDDEAVFATLKAKRSAQRRPRAAVPDEDDDDEDTYEAEANDIEEDDGIVGSPLLTHAELINTY
jgi:DNA mismatch repair protein MSH6